MTFDELRRRLTHGSCSTCGVVLSLPRTVKPLRVANPAPIPAAKHRFCSEECREVMVAQLRLAGMALQPEGPL